MENIHKIMALLLYRIHELRQEEIVSLSKIIEENVAYMECDEENRMMVVTRSSVYQLH